MFAQQYSNRHDLKDKNFASASLSFNSISNSFFEDDEVDYDLLSKLENIEENMLNGDGVQFKDVSDLEKRYDL